jgi:hypothetical protein
MPPPEESSSIGKVVKVISGVGGVILFVIAVAGAIQYFKAPRVTVVPSGPLSLSYKRAENVIEMSFDLTLDNTGYGSEVIKSTNARVLNSAVPPPANFIPFTNADLLFVEKSGDSGPAPITIAADQPRKVKCILHHTPGGISTSVIETRGKLHLFVNLFGKKKYLGVFGEDKHYSMEFCFESNGLSLQELGAQPNLFHSVGCPQH